MKKFILFTLILVTLLSSTVFATERVTRDERQKKLVVFETAQIVAQNRESIRILFDEVREKTKETKQKIKTLLDNKDDLTTEQLVMLKDSLTQIKLHQQTLKDTLGQIDAYNEAVKKARDEKDFNQLLVLYNAILGIQEIRINELTQYQDILDSLLSI